MDNYTAVSFYDGYPEMSTDLLSYKENQSRNSRNDRNTRNFRFEAKKPTDDAQWERINDFYLDYFS